MPGSYCEVSAQHPIHGPFHDLEHGFPIRSDSLLFERLVLEINQAGLSWLTVLRKRDHFRRAFANYELEVIARFGEAEQRRLMADVGIIRNRLKIAAMIENARQVLALGQEFGGFANWLDAHHPRDLEAWSKLFKKTFRFTGGEIVNEFLMGVGYLPGAHVAGCPVYSKVLELSPPWAVEPRKNR
ncbi:MAG: DNA-3-methyladenine glycosylase I [Acidobacteria bacterium]|nr:DNA-3-methyladenine glycosylase I [Acidobacteriota bacterium]